MGWVGTLGVVREWRRHGLGLALLQHSFQQFYQRGKRKVGLGVDAQSLTGRDTPVLKGGHASRSGAPMEHDGERTAIWTGIEHAGSLKGV